MARKSKKSKGSKKARAGKKSGAKKSTAKKSGTSEPVAAEAAVAEAPSTVEADGASAVQAESPEPDVPDAEQPKPTKKKRGKATRKKKAEPEAEPEAPPSPEAPTEAAAETTADAVQEASERSEDAAPEPSPEPKSKSKKRRGKSKAKRKEEPVEPPAPPPAEEPEPVTISLDDVDDEEPVPVAFSLEENESAPTTVSLDDDESAPTTISLDDDEDEPVIISLDDDEDDHEARERLIAEALAFVAEEEGEVPPAAAAPSTAGLADADVEDAPAGTADDEPPEEGEAGEARPRLTVDALLALSEMRSQGITLPGELILDLGESISEQDRDRLLAAAMAHAEMQEAIYRIPVATQTDTWIKAGIASAVLFLALVIGVWPPGLLLPEPPPTLTGQDAVTGLQVTLLLQAQQIEAFRVAEDRLPSSLDEAGPVFDGVRYVRSGNRLYQLVAYRRDGEPIIFDSAAPAPEFQALARTWLPSGDDS